jgi:hypothetical protein
MKIENISTLKINLLTQEQYDREKANGTLDENALYLTEGGSSGGSGGAEGFVTEAQVREIIAESFTNATEVPM